MGNEQIKTVEVICSLGWRDKRSQTHSEAYFVYVQGVEIVKAKVEITKKQMLA